MNKNRKNELINLNEQIEVLKSRLEDILNEEQEYYDNVPENMQSGERYENSENAISEMESAISSLDEAMENISTIIEN